MKKYLWFFLLILCPEAFAQTFSDGVYNISAFNDANNTINSGATVNALTPNMAISNPSTYITNHGTINGNINLAGNNLNITNAGMINGQIINTGSIATVRQTISSGDEFKALNVSGPELYVNITNIDNLTVNSLTGLGAQHFKLTNSDIYVNSLSDWNGWVSDVTLSGLNTLHIQNVNTIHSGDIIRYVTDVNNIAVDIIDNDDLYTTNFTYAAGNVMLNIVRKTDYTSVFSDNRGVLLNNLRITKPQDKLILKIDSATSMSELESVMNSSYRFNHKVLMRPLYIANSFMMFDFEDDTDVYFSPFYIGGDKTSGFGGKGHIGGKYENVHAAIGFHINKLNYKNSFNDFDVMTFGPELKAKIDMDKFWVRGNAGLTVAKYSADNIYHHDSVTKNPNGKSGYLVIDAGKDFVFDKELSAIGFVGTGLQSMKVLDVHDVDYILHTGAGIKYVYELVGVRYEYSGTGAIATNGDLIGNLKFGFWSVADEAGIYFDLDVSKNKYDLNYKASVSAKLMF